MTTKTFTEALNDFLAYANDVIKATYGEEQTDLALEQGRRYVRLVTSHFGSTSRSVYGFVDLTTGDILKPAGWKAPAKHARGNIYNIETFTCAGPYGIAYLAGGYGSSVNKEELAKTEKKAGTANLPKKKREPKKEWVGHRCPEGFCEHCAST